MIVVPFTIKMKSRSVLCDGRRFRMDKIVGREKQSAFTSKRNSFSHFYIYYMYILRHRAVDPQIGHCGRRLKSVSSPSRFFTFCSGMSLQMCAGTFTNLFKKRQKSADIIRLAHWQLYFSMIINYFNGFDSAYVCSMLLLIIIHILLSRLLSIRFHSFRWRFVPFLFVPFHFHSLSLSLKMICVWIDWPGRFSK